MVARCAPTWARWTTLTIRDELVGLREARAHRTPDAIGRDGPPASSQTHRPSDFASDALSSVAYAPDEVLLTLALAGTMAAMQSIWVGVVVALVLAVVVASYRQTVHAYPSGGGDYEVVTKNLGRSWGLLVPRPCWSTTS